MIIIRPTIITQAMITANNLVNADPDWVSTTTYAANVKVTYNNQIYLSSQGSNLGKIPGDTASTGWWSLVTSSNRWAAFDDEVQTQSSRDDNITVALNVNLTNSVALLNLTNVAQAVVSVMKSGTTVYTKTIDGLDRSVMQTWGEYLQNTPEFVDNMAITDLPKIPGASLYISLTNTGNTVAIGKIVIGQTLAGGAEDYGLTRSGTDYSSATFDKYGKLTLDKQLYVRDFSTIATVDSSRFDSIGKRLDSIASLPIVCIGGNGLFSTLIVYGLLTYQVVVENYSTLRVKYDLKGLS